MKVTRNLENLARVLLWNVSTLRHFNTISLVRNLDWTASQSYAEPNRADTLRAPRWIILVLLFDIRLHLRADTEELSYLPYRDQASQNHSTSEASTEDFSDSQLQLRLHGFFQLQSFIFFTCSEFCFKRLHISLAMLQMVLSFRRFWRLTFYATSLKNARSSA